MATRFVTPYKPKQRVIKFNIDKKHTNIEEDKKIKARHRGISNKKTELIQPKRTNLYQFSSP